MRKRDIVLAVFVANMLTALVWAFIGALVMDNFRQQALGDDIRQRYEAAQPEPNRSPEP